MSNGNGDGGKMVLKVELVDKKLVVKFGQELPNTLLYDRAIRLASLELDNMIIGGQQNQQPYKPFAVTEIPLSIMDKIRGK